VSDPVLQEDLKGVAHEIVVVSLAFEVPRGPERGAQRLPRDELVMAA